MQHWKSCDATAILLFHVELGGRNSLTLWFNMKLGNHTQNTAAQDQSRRSKTAGTVADCCSQSKSVARSSRIQKVKLIAQACRIRAQVQIVCVRLKSPVGYSVQAPSSDCLIQSHDDHMYQLRLSRHPKHPSSPQPCVHAHHWPHQLSWIPGPLQKTLCTGAS